MNRNWSEGIGSGGIVSGGIFGVVFGCVLYRKSECIYMHLCVYGWMEVGGREYMEEDVSI